MSNVDIPASVIALIGTLFGGAGLTLTTKWASKNKDREDAATKFRDELRSEVIRLREELAKVEKELDEWKEKYYALLQDGIMFKKAVERQIEEREANHDNSNSNGDPGPQQG